MPHEIPPARRESDHELVRTDIFYASAAALEYLNSANPVLRTLAEGGHLDQRCTSKPVELAPL